MLSRKAFFVRYCLKKDLEIEVDNKKQENEQMLIHIVQTLAGTIDAKDTYTKGHSGRVADYSREIAKRCGYKDNQLNDIYMMGLLHDIGKITIDIDVLNKPGKLTDKEFNIIKSPRKYYGKAGACCRCKVAP